MSLETSLSLRLADLEARHLLREPHARCPAPAPWLQVDGRRYLSLSSNDYLGLAADPRISRAAQAALQEWGTGATSSRLVTGTTAQHRQAEARLAVLVSLPSALLFSSGYAANVGALSALVGEGDVLFSDELNHASLIDGCRLSKARAFIYRHNDLDHLRALLEAHRSSFKTALVVTEAVFSMDGDAAPLSMLRDLADEHRCDLMVDEAHSLGLWGPCGGGLCADQRVVPDILIGPLGKALGCAGAFVAGSERLTRVLENDARSFVFSTGVPPALAAAAESAADCVAGADDRRTLLHERTRMLREGLREQGWAVPKKGGPIAPLSIGAPEQALRLSTGLREQGIWAAAIRPPTVPAGTSRLRLVATSAHEPEHLSDILGAFGRLASLASEMR